MKQALSCGLANAQETIANGGIVTHEYRRTRFAKQQRRFRGRGNGVFLSRSLVHRLSFYKLYYWRQALHPNLPVEPTKSFCRAD